MLEPISASLALAPLLIEWAKERRELHEEVSEKAFRAWLQDSAFPQLLGASQTTFDLLSAGQKAHHAELLGYLERQFSELHSTLLRLRADHPAPVSFGDRWQKLGSVAIGLLNALVEQVQGASYEEAMLKSPFNIPNATDTDVLTGWKRLAEIGLVHYLPYSGQVSLRLSGLGYLVTTASREPEEFEARLVRLQGGIRQYQALPIDKLVAHTMGRCPAPFAYAVIERWDAMGWISLQKLDQREHSRIMHPTQAFMDADSVALRRKTLEPFLS